MEQIALYRKYRPKNFDDLYGQDVSKQILINSIKNNNISHAYLFYGPRGTGKTSTAKILARTLNCLNPNGYIACGECENCEVSFNESECVDIIEIDAASNNGVDEIRELKSKIDLVPNKLKYKVYIIDEIQMLTKEAFNALLKTLEEPPKHAIFIMATTEIKKVPDTIISRCQVLEFKRIDSEEIYKRLEYICKNEKIKIEENALKLISENSNGGLRDALGYLDKAISFSDNEKITEENIKKILNLSDEDDLEKLYNILVKKDDKKLLEELDKHKKSSIDPVSLMTNLLEYIYKQIYKSKDNLEKDIFIINYLNELIEKIKKSDFPYIIMEVNLLKLILGYKDEKPKEIVIKEKEVLIQKEDCDNEEKPKVKKLDLDKIELRTNNCFAKADKKLKNKVIKKLETIDQEGKVKKSNKIISDLLDSNIEVVSDEYVILSNEKDSFVKLANLKEKAYRKEFNKLLDSNFKLVFLTKEEWEKEKAKFVRLFKEGKTIEYKEEKEEEEKEDVYDEALSVFGDDVIKMSK